MSGHERGAALITAMGLVVIVLMIGVSAARAAFSSEKSARRERDRLVAFAAAEAALRDAERDMESGSRAALFDGSGSGFVEGCGSAATNHGLCGAAPSHKPPAWQVADLEDALFSVAYGEFTARGMASAAPGHPYRLPRYVIETLPAPGGAAGAIYRITAIGFGVHDGTRVVLQAVYHKPGAAPLPAGRIGWREIANWPELHAAAIK